MPETAFTVIVPATLSTTAYVIPSELRSIMIWNGVFVNSASDVSNVQSRTTAVSVMSAACKALGPGSEKDELTGLLLSRILHVIAVKAHSNNKKFFMRMCQCWIMVKDSAEPAAGIREKNILKDKVLCVLSRFIFRLVGILGI